MKEHAVEHGTFRMSGAIDSCHSRESFIKKRANLMGKSGSPWIIGESTKPAGKIKPGKCQPALTAIHDRVPSEAVCKRCEKRGKKGKMRKYDGTKDARLSLPPRGWKEEREG